MSALYLCVWNSEPEALWESASKYKFSDRKPNFNVNSNGENMFLPRIYTVANQVHKKRRKKTLGLDKRDYERILCLLIY